MHTLLRPSADGPEAHADVDPRRNGHAPPKSDGQRYDAPPAKQPPRLFGVVGVTAIEGLSIYLWLRLHESGRPLWGLLALLVGEIVETELLRRFVDRGGLKRWRALPPGAAALYHGRKVQRKLGIAGNAEIAIWLLWLACAYELSQPIAAVALLVTMHIKHQVETAAVRDTPFRSGLFSPKSLLGSAFEVAGAVACLALVLDGQFVLAAVAIGVGLLIEHWMLIDLLLWEITARDIRVPRDPRWKSPKRPLPAFAAYAASHYAPLWRLVQRIAPLERVLNRLAINSLIARVEPRPNPLSTKAPYTSWASLTDRTFSGRHLPPVESDARRKPEDAPASAAVAALFKRDKIDECPKTTVLFSFFAQWFTDGFLRTERDPTVTTAPDGTKPLRNTSKNESNHEIDLATLYGMKDAATRQLRGERGLLKSQVINGEEYPRFYCTVDAVTGKPTPNLEEFGELPPPLDFAKIPDEQRKTLFAMGTDTRNIGFIAFNVLFLREHNRIARQLGDENPTWDSDRIFETTRNIVIVVLLKLVVEEYINHINPNLFEFRLDAESFRNEPWIRPNWMAIEFNLLYRWHSLVPSTFHLGGSELPISALLSDTTVLTSAGLGPLLAAASAQPAGRMSLFNTDELLALVAEKPTIEQGRAAGLASYNDYRRLCRHPPVTSFDEISSDPKVRERLAELYPGGVEDVEFYVGLYAEDLGPNDVLPPMMLTMVAFDAFSQALTNPLLGPRVFNEQTFSATGMEIIKTTRNISDIVQRNVPPQSEPYFISLTRRGYRRV